MKTYQIDNLASGLAECISSYKGASNAKERASDDRHVYLAYLRLEAAKGGSARVQARRELFLDQARQLLFT